MTSIGVDVCAQTMIQEISIDLLDTNPFQPRQNEDGLEELAADIAARGLIHPPVARAVNGRYQLACGHRRVAACRMLGWEVVPVDVRDLSDQDMALMAWSENESRKGLNPLERAEAIRRMMQEFGWTQEEAGQRLGLARSTVANILRLLDLRPEVQEALQAGRISERQALALAPLSELQWEKTDGWVHRRVREILEGKRQASSDEIRDLMRSAREEASRPLSLARFDQGECAECPHRKTGRCYNVECFDRKMAEEKERALQAIRQETGILRWEGTELPPIMLHYAVRKAQERRCPNLRLAPSRWHDARPEYVCALGHECRCARDAEEEFQEEIRRKNEERQALIARLTGRLSEAMRGLDDRVLRTILVLLAPGTAPSDLDLSYQIARVMATALVSYSHWPEAEKVLQDWENE